MVYEPQDDDLHCRHSLKNIIVNSFTWPIIVFGMIYLVLMIAFFTTAQQDYRLSTLTLNCILALVGICSIIVGYFFYKNQKSECLFFTDSGVYLRGKNRIQWQCDYKEISGARVEYVSSKYSSGHGHPEAVIILKNGKKLKIPWGLNETNRPEPGVVTTGFLPFQLLKNRGIPVQFDKASRVHRKLSSIALPFVGVMLLALMVFTVPLIYKMAKSSALLCFDGENLKTFTIPGQLKAIRFVSIAAGTGGKIYIGTESSGVYCFENGKFNPTGPGLPSKFVKYLFITNTFQKYEKKTNFFFIPDVFTTSSAPSLIGWGCHPLDEFQNSLWAILWNTSYSYNGPHEIFFLESGKWHPFAKRGWHPQPIIASEVAKDIGKKVSQKNKVSEGINKKYLAGKKIRHINFDEENIYISTDTGLLIFSRMAPSTKPGTLFAKQMVAKTFLYDGHLHVLTKKKTKRNIYRFTLQRQDNDNWETIFEDKTLFWELMTYDKNGSLWIASNGHTLVNPETGVFHSLEMSGDPGFRKIILENDIFIGIHFSQEKFKGRYAAVIRFDPRDEKPYVTVIEKFPIHYSIDFSVDQNRNIWTFTH